MTHTASDPYALVEFKGATVMNIIVHLNAARHEMNLAPLYENIGAAACISAHQKKPFYLKSWEIEEVCNTLFQTRNAMVERDLPAPIKAMETKALKLCARFSKKAAGVLGKFETSDALKSQLAADETILMRAEIASWMNQGAGKRLVPAQ